MRLARDKFDGHSSLVEIPAMSHIPPFAIRLKNPMPFANKNGFNFGYPQSGVSPAVTS
jgi:hypothetical protein